jgi:hypothetical protein
MSADLGESESALAVEVAIVGMCHRLNGQLAAASAYVYLMKRRGQLGGMEEALQGHMDDLAHSVRLIRSLCRETEEDRSPIALSLLAETATDVMMHHPSTVVTFVPSGETGGVIHADWARTLRAVLIVGTWITRGATGPADVELRLGNEDREALYLRAPGDLPEPSAQAVTPEEVGSPGLSIEQTGPRTATIRFES